MVGHKNQCNLVTGKTPVLLFYLEIHKLADYNNDMILYVDETENKEFLLQEEERSIKSGAEGIHIYHVVAFDSFGNL